MTSVLGTTGQKSSSFLSESANDDTMTTNGRKRIVDVPRSFVDDDDDTCRFFDADDDTCRFFGCT